MALKKTNCNLGAPVRLRVKLWRMLLNGLLKALDTGNLRPDDVTSAMNGVSAQDQMLLLNLLGGRLAMGHRMAGASLEQVERRVLERLERTLRRIDRVAELIDEALASTSD